MLNILRRGRAERETADRLLVAVLSRSRDRAFFERLGVADTFDGRFDLTVLHAWMVLEALSRLGGRGLAQRLTDALFTQFDEGLREQGAGDIGMGRRMKKIANAFYGRLGAYRAAQSPDALTEALHRNVYRGAPDTIERAQMLARYVQTAVRALDGSDILAGQADFGPVP
jgi:cytochrome b pre-mRNA-processing protein 3